MANLTSLQDLRQTKKYACFMEKMGWKVIKINPTSLRFRRASNETINAFIKKLPILPFSVIKILRYKSKLQLTKLKNLAKKHKAILVKLEPFEIEKIKNGRFYFKVLGDNKWPLVPTKTLWIDLTKSEKNILLAMKQKTRYNIRLAQRKNLKIQIISGNKTTENQLLDFYSIWKKNKPHNWLFRPNFNELKYLVESFGKKCFFVFIFQKQLLLASCLILSSKNMAFYWYNASTSLGKKLFAPTLCVWQAIKEAKKRKLKIFDFEGLWDERFPKLNKNWKGFTKFKKGFVKK